MKYLSICSGIEAASTAWHPLGWEPVGFSEIEPFPSAVLAHHWPEVLNLGDMTKHHEWPKNLKPNLIVGGTPCQAFSVAGLRQGLADPRGNLTLTFLSIVEQYRPAWVVWENVPGILSEKTGAFGAFLGGLAELGYGFAYRVLDAQYFGVAQRRRRVFVVANLGDWRSAAAVLFERESLSRDTVPIREAREKPAKCLTRGTSQRYDFETEDFIIKKEDSKIIGIRRLTPTECERLQGFPDGYTLIPWRGKPADQCPDGPRYKALGNSMAVPVMAWIGKRINNYTHTL